MLRFWGDFPEFAQRFYATLGSTFFEGQWQLARTPGDWQDDLPPPGLDPAAHRVAATHAHYLSGYVT
ncbi:MAG: hypothetical protein WAU42_09385 [Solirubrobacteraceae bacterium]